MDPPSFFVGYLVCIRLKNDGITKKMFIFYMTLKLIHRITYKKELDEV